MTRFGNGTGPHEIVVAEKSGRVFDRVAEAARNSAAVLTLLGMIGGGVVVLFAYLGSLAKSDAVDLKLAAIRTAQKHLAEAVSSQVSSHETRISVLEATSADIRSILGWQKNVTLSRMSKQEKQKLPPPPTIVIPKDEE